MGSCAWFGAVSGDWGYRERRIGVAYGTNISRVNNLFLKCAGSINLLK